MRIIKTRHALFISEYDNRFEERGEGDSFTYMGVVLARSEPIVNKIRRSISVGSLICYLCILVDSIVSLRYRITEIVLRNERSIF